MKLSIILPTFNRLDLLSEAIQSILHHQPWIYEIIIADDGSTDGTDTWCLKLKDTSPSTQIVISRSSKNLGAQKARNRGYQIAQGDVVMFMDSDDILAKDGVVPLLQQLERYPDLDYVYGNVVRTNAFLKPTAHVLPVGSSFSSNAAEIAGYHWHTMGAIYRKDYLQKVGPWNEKLTGSQDWEFQARVKLMGGVGKFIDHTVGYWRDHSAERVGTKKFRLDYVESVIEACLSIHDKAKAMSKLDSALERRLMKKLLLHTLELSVYDYPAIRQKHLMRSLDSICFNLPIKLVIQILLLLPPQVDLLLWKIFSRKQFLYP